jgi:hypothetical protein
MFIDAEIPLIFWQPLIILHERFLCGLLKKSIPGEVLRGAIVSCFCQPPPRADMEPKVTLLYGGCATLSDLRAPFGVVVLVLKAGDRAGDSAGRAS